MNTNQDNAFQTYDEAPAGIYACMQCGNNENKNGTITIKKKATLPECENCGYTTWLKIQ